MTATTPEVETPVTTLGDLDEDWEIPCDIMALNLGAGWPKCRGERAEWIGWRPGCCSKGPRYRLICTFCKNVYQKWQARQAAIMCPHCGTETGGFASFTPLRKS